MVALILSSTSAFACDIECGDAGDSELSNRLEKLDCGKEMRIIREYLVEKRNYVAIESNYLSMRKKERVSLAKELRNSERIIQDCLVKHVKDTTHGDFIEALVKISNMPSHIEFNEENDINRAPPDYVVESYDDTIKALKK